MTIAQFHICRREIDIVPNRTEFLKRFPDIDPGELVDTWTLLQDCNFATVRACTAIPVSIGETRRVDALYVDYYAESGEHFEYVVFNEPMPENEEEFVQMFDYPEEWDSYSDTLETVKFTDDEE